MIKLVTLDFDGTVADTMPTLESIAVKLLATNYPLSRKEARIRYQKTTGLPFEQQVEIICPGNSKNIEIVNEFEKEKLQRIFDLPLFPDARSTIQFLRKKDYLVAISSSTIQSTIEKYCQLKNLKVDVILGYRKGFEKGTDHFNFLKEKFQLKANELIYVGDSLKDCQRAEKNNIYFIGKIGMFSKKEFQQTCQIQITIQKLSELITIVPALNQKTMVNK